MEMDIITDHQPQKKQDPPADFEHSDFRNTFQPNIFSAHRAVLYSPKHIKDFWKRTLLTKHSDETIHTVGKAISYDFSSKRVS